MKVDEELKRKRAELIGEVEELTARIQAINGQVSAIDQVIEIYDPAYAPLGTAAPKPPRPRAAKQLPPEFARINKNEAILEVLREAERPVNGCGLMFGREDGRDLDARARRAHRGGRVASIRCGGAPGCWVPALHRSKAAALSRQCAESTQAIQS